MLPSLPYSHRPLVPFGGSKLDPRSPQCLLRLHGEPGSCHCPMRGEAGEGVGAAVRIRPSVSWTRPAVDGWIWVVGCGWLMLMLGSLMFTWFELNLSLWRNIRNLSWFSSGDRSELPRLHEKKGCASTSGSWPFNLESPCFKKSSCWSVKISLS